MEPAPRAEPPGPQGHRGPFRPLGMGTAPTEGLGPAEAPSRPLPGPKKIGSLGASVAFQRTAERSRPARSGDSRGMATLGPVAGIKFIKERISPGQLSRRDAKDLGLRTGLKGCQENEGHPRWTGGGSCHAGPSPISSPSMNKRQSSKSGRSIRDA